MGNRKEGKKKDTGEGTAEGKDEKNRRQKKGSKQPGKNKKEKRTNGRQAKTVNNVRVPKYVKLLIKQLHFHACEIF